VLVLFGFGALLMLNTSPSLQIAPLMPTVDVVQAQDNKILRNVNSPALPTVAIPAQPFTLPTLAIRLQGTATPFYAIDAVPIVDEPIIAAATPTAPTMNDADVPPATIELLAPPISRDVLGRDHYWLSPPVDLQANTIVDVYGSGDSIQRGIDMAGQVVHAAGSGMVIWAGDGYVQDGVLLRDRVDYGRVVVIAHDFGYRGQAMYTLYADLSELSVELGQVVAMGDALGYVGDGGRVHFEVRVGENAHWATVNPTLWMVPAAGHGVIAGRVVDGDGNLVTNADITIRRRVDRVVQATTLPYNRLSGLGYAVRSDPNWNENFVAWNVPQGAYDVMVMIDGMRVVRSVDVLEGVTVFVELKPIDDDANASTETLEGQS
jgi:murein DD-endopeptidase MepM/ murein hydrolase activator NlpD